MQQPFPIEFTDQGDEIHLHIEEYDLIRVISMREGSTSASVPPTILGESFLWVPGLELLPYECTDG